MRDEGKGLIKHRRSQVLQTIRHAPERLRRLPRKRLNASETGPRVSVLNMATESVPRNWGGEYYAKSAATQDGPHVDIS